ncbi:MAG: GerMN domain-containing protein [Thermoanaerobaculum sp.]
MKRRLALAWLLGMGAFACHRAAPPPPAPGPAQTPSSQTTFVVLVFPGEDLLLHRETRELPELPAGVEAQARIILQELLAGPRTPLAPVAWWPAEVLDVFHHGKGTVFVNLTPPPAVATGSEAELALHASIATTLALNIKTVQWVQLLFGGKEVETLGHLDFSRPLPPRWDLVAP